MAKNGMSDLEMVPERVNTIERKLDALASSVDQRFDAVDQRFDTLTLSIDKRFDEVTAAFVEQRQYTEFAFTRLEKRMTEGFATMETRFLGVDNRLERLERKLDRALDLRRRARRPRRK